MAHRSITDPRGTVWQVWDVVPSSQLLERRSGADRRVRMEAVEVERRVSEERRHSLVNSRLDSGWLCFESPSEKRRFFPIPRQWDRFADDQLLRLCEQASPTRKR